MDPAATCAAVVRAITRQRGETPPGRSVLVGITGIDGSGKGYVADQIGTALRRSGLRAGLIHADEWLTTFRQAGPTGLSFEHTGGSPPPSAARSRSN